MSTPLPRTWHHPSHPTIQEVVLAQNSIFSDPSSYLTCFFHSNTFPNPALIPLLRPAPLAPPLVRSTADAPCLDQEFTSKSLSKISLPPFALFAVLAFPPCTEADKPSYATVQMGKGRHLNLNSDLVYTNHSCEPSLIFDHSTNPSSVLAGPQGLKAGQELTFFYPSTEWEMAQPFDCFCGTPSCKGLIDGAGKMGREKLEGAWLNGYIRDMLDDQEKGMLNDGSGVNGVGMGEESKGKDRNALSNREMSGEMGGDTGGVKSV